MSSLSQVIFYSLIGGVVSLIGGFILLSSKKRAKALAQYATPFAAGALLAAAFMDLLRESVHSDNAEQALQFALVGILLFFFLERFLRFFHHHHEHEDSKSDPTIPLVVIGDTIHNFIDGVAIAGGFLISPSTGIVVTLAVAAHEIPQEIGDFGLLLRKGMKPKKVILVNLLSALATLVAAVIFFQIGQAVDVPIEIVMGLVAGFFIYIAVSDIIPSIHKSEEKVLAGPQSLMLLIGIVLTTFATTTLHDYIDQGHAHEHGDSHLEEHDEEHADEHDDEQVDEHKDVHADEHDEVKEL